MKKCIITILFFTVINAEAQVGIGKGNVIPPSSAALEIRDTTKGILIPRMKISQRNAILNPVEGLMIYQTDSTKGYWYYDGAQWQNINALRNGGGRQTLVLSGDITNAQAAAKIAKEAGPNTQEIRIIGCSNLTIVDLSMISDVVQVLITDNKVLQSVNLSNLVNCLGEFNIQRCPLLTTLNVSALENIANVNIAGIISYTGLTALNFPSLKKIVGSFSPTPNKTLTTISLPSLTTVGGTFTLNGNPQITSYSFPSLTTVGGSLVFSDLTGNFVSPIISISCPALTGVNGDLTLQSHLQLSSIFFPLLDSVEALIVSGNPKLSSVSFPALKTVKGQLQIRDNTALLSITLPALTTTRSISIYSNLITSMSLPSLTSMTDPNFNSYIYGSSLTSVSFDNLTSFNGSGFMVGSHLPSSQVNYLLHKFATIVPPLTGKQFTLGQTPPAPPSGQGITDKATLVANGNYVTTD